MTIDIEGIRKRLEAATPGPWRKALGSGHNLLTAVFGPADTEDEVLIADNAPDWAIKEKKAAHVTQANANLDFIANAPTDIAALLQANKDLAGEVERLKAQQRPLSNPSERNFHYLSRDNPLGDLGE